MLKLFLKENPKSNIITNISQYKRKYESEEIDINFNKFNQLRETI